MVVAASRVHSRKVNDMNGRIFGAMVLGAWAVWHFVNKLEYDEWKEKMVDDPEYCAKVEAWLLEHPAPDSWEGTKYEWAYTEMI